MAMPESGFQAFVPGQLAGAGGERTVCDVIASDLELQCHICKYIMENPQFLGCCAKCLCEVCVEKIRQSTIQDMRRCPFCQEQSFTTLLNRHLQKRVHGLAVRCPNHSKGCSWQGKLIQVQCHISPQAAAEEVSCLFQVVKCQRHGCTAEVLKKDLRHHEDQLCEHRLYTCKFCLDVTNTYHKVSTEHFPVCPEYTVRCPNQGCPEYLTRGTLHEHLSMSCLYEEVACDYASAGCDKKCLRKDVESHCEVEAHHHNKLLLKQNALLQAKLVENEGKLSLMGARLDALTIVTEGHAATAPSGDVAEKITNLEHRFANESNILRNELTGMTSEVFMLKDSLEEMRGTLSETACKDEVISQLSKECQKLSDCLEALKLSVIERIESAVVQQISPTLSVMDELRDKTTSNLSLLHEAQKSLDHVQRCINPQPPFGFTVSRFSERRFKKEPFVSPAFYTHRGGYKVCIRVDLHGPSSHVAVHCCIMRGEHDQALPWPFKGHIHVQIQNQLGNHTHYLKVITYDDTTAENKSGQVVTGDKNYLHGFNQFISHQELGMDEIKRCQYLMGDAIDFEVVKVDLQS